MFGLSGFKFVALILPFSSRGFKDANTAHVMMQRAKKLKYNAERRKKLGKLGKDHSNYQYNLSKCIIEIDF